MRSHSQCGQKRKFGTGDNQTGDRENFTYRLDQKITLIGDAFFSNVAGISSSIDVQTFGKISPWELRNKIREKTVKLNYPFVVVCIGGYQLMTHKVQQIVEGIKLVVLALRARLNNGWIGISTLLYRPKDETMSKAKIDAVNIQLQIMTNELAAVGCKVVLVRAHNALISPVDNKLLRPIHVYYQDGLVPSRQAAYLLARYFVVCALEIVRKC